MSDESLPPPEGSLKFWDESSEHSEGNVSRIFNLYDYGDDMQEIDENYDKGSALSLYEGHSYTPASVKMDDMEIENERMIFLDSLYKSIREDRADKELAYKKVTECTVGWFNRSSFVEKLNFILSLLENNSSLSFLQILHRAISDPANSKDLVYSTNQGIGAFEYDVVAEGQCMSMDVNTLRQVQAVTCVWFASFGDLQKLQLMLNMLANSGGAILRRVFLEVDAIVTARQLRLEQLNAIKAAGTLYKIAAKYGLSDEAVRELPFEVLQKEHNLIVETEQEEERLRKDLGSLAKNEFKKEKKKKGKDKKGNEKDSPEEGKPQEEESRSKEEKRAPSLVDVGDFREENHPLDVAAREMLEKFEQALEKVRLALKVDEHGKQYPAPPPPVEEVEKKERDEKNSKKEKESKKGKGGKRVKEEKETPQKKGKKEKPQKKGKKGKGIDVDPGVDRIQLLPLTLNRRILLTLEEKQLKSLKQVSTYWARMVDDITAEEKARKMIDDAIRKMASGELSSFAKSSKKSGKEGKKGKKTGSDKSSKKSAKSSKKSTKSSKSEKSSKSATAEALVEVPSRVAAAQGHEATLAAFGGTQDSTSSDVYTYRCLRVNVASRFFGGRVTAQSVDGRMFASSNARREVEFYSLRSGALLPFRLVGHDRCVTCMAYLEVEGTEYVVTGSKDRSARLWNVPLLASEKTYLGHTDVITGVAATDKHVATTGADKILRVCDLRSAIPEMSVQLDQAPSALSLSEDPTSVFLGFPSGDIAVYRVDTNTPVLTVAAHDAEVTCLHLAATVLASGGADKVARLWHVANFSANCLTAFKHNSAVCCVHLTRQQLVSANQDATFSVWSVTTGEKLRQVRMPSACRIVGLAVLTDAEYARVLVSADLAVYAFEFYLHGSLRRRTSSRVRRSKIKVAQDAPAAPKVHFEEGACASGGCTGLPITSRHPPYHRSARHEERDKLRKRLGFPEPRFFEAIHGAAMRPQGFLHELLNYEQMEDEISRAVCLFPQAQTTEREVPAPPRYPPIDPNAPKVPDSKYKLRRSGRLDTCYQSLLQKYNARYPILDI